MGKGPPGCPGGVRRAARPERRRTRGALRRDRDGTSDSPTGEDGGAVGFTTRSLPPEAVAAELFDKEHQPGDLLGPVRGDAGYYVMQFHERARLAAAAGRDGQEPACRSPAPTLRRSRRNGRTALKAEDGGEIGWLTKDQLDETLRDPVFSLEPGGVTDVLELGEEHYFVKVLEKAKRALDADQIPDIRLNAFDNWYAPKKDQAKTDDVIVIAGETEDDTTLEPGED